MQRWRFFAPEGAQNDIKIYVTLSGAPSSIGRTGGKNLVFGGLVGTKAGGK